MECGWGGVGWRGAGGMCKETRSTQHGSDRDLDTLGPSKDINIMNSNMTRTLIQAKFGIWYIAAGCWLNAKQVLAKSNIPSQYHMNSLAGLTQGMYEEAGLECDVMRQKCVRVN